MTTQTAWPENVIARYLTLVGATVDLTHRNEAEDGKKKATRAVCTGCRAVTVQTWADSYPNYRRPGVTEFQNQDKGDRAARAWAQKHAETCRALAAPTVPATAPEPQDEPEPKRRLWLPARRKNA
ncbi:hypothetical protein GTY83_07140 [Streptomyces sp. SID4928]|uniref:hypothetical protein n=1 Tax=Streptomyces TaxID=1883 RepID=UPI0001C1C993|nr:hypothetical protein [Streptomyces sp. ACT-1]EGE40809.1 hypothetical protein SACT1_1444 [Streptomyces sp. ACT-1]MYR48880.1 hypothetical protein [Streptomyces sp. SID4928]